MTFSAALRDRILVGDGANGTCLASKGYQRRPYDLASLDVPDILREVHAEYLRAGADFIETNTFYANPLRLGDQAELTDELNLAAARIAREAIRGEGLEGERWVLGAIGPCGKPVEPIGSVSREEVFESVRLQALALLEGEVDGFILETFVDLIELRIAVEAVRSVTDLPIIASKAFIEDGESLAEGLPMRAAHEMKGMGVEAVGANCIVGPQRMLDLVRMMVEAIDGPILAFPTPGLPQLVKGLLTYDSRPAYFAKAAARLVEAGATIIGGCCGTTPDHIRALKQEIANVHAKPRHTLESRREASEKAPMPKAEPSELGEKLKKGSFVVAVEMDVPRGLKIEKLLAGARSLKIAGADVINISDGARARLRMNPSAVANLIQTRVGIEVTMHFSCRDRNLLAIQSDLLGCHAIGVRNVLAVTGDPANVGDYPSATSVFDIDSIGLVRVLQRFNDGIDMAGYSLGMQCGFTIAVAFNPKSSDPDNELDRLRRKIDAGANLVYTQPVFDFETAEMCKEECQKLNVPVFIGVLPLRSTRHAEFMHNEVPGIEVPDHLRQSMADAASDADALEIGVHEATVLARQIKSIANGLYLMPPFGSAVIAERVMQGVQ